MIQHKMTDHLIKEDDTLDPCFQWLWHLVLRLNIKLYNIVFVIINFQKFTVFQNLFSFGIKIRFPDNLSALQETLHFNF